MYNNNKYILFFGATEKSEHCLSYIHTFFFFFQYHYQHENVLNLDTGHENATSGFS